jgi:hypothetical protein
MLSLRYYYKMIFSVAQMGQHNHEEHCNEVIVAYKKLMEDVLPSYAKRLDERGVKQILIKELHRSGINVRYLGLIRSSKIILILSFRSFATNKDVKSALLQECIGKVTVILFN